MTSLKKYQMYIDGQWVNSESEKSFESYNPATEEPWAIIPEAGVNDVDRAVQAAHRAFNEGPWSKMTATERGKLLRRLAEVLNEHSETLGRTETKDTGKLLPGHGGVLDRIDSYLPVIAIFQIWLFI